MINQDESGQLKLAVLIDADNAEPKIIEGLLAEIAKYGIASVKRIYGDWTSSKLSKWKTNSLEYSIHPIQQFAYTTGKNSTDSALIIDAMDLLYTKTLDGFCIVSSDSDFTRLASRLREAGMLVLGFGEKKTPKAFLAACDKFIYTEILRESSEEEVSSKDDKIIKKPQVEKMDKKLKRLLFEAVEDSADEFGWSYLAPVGQFVSKRQPDFDSRNYGFKKLVGLIRACSWFEIEERSNPTDTGKQVYIRKK